MKQTIVLLLLVTCFSTSCKKENPNVNVYIKNIPNVNVYTDIELNQQIDKKFADNILTMSSSERDNLALEKEIVLRRIIKNNPKIRFSDLYPKKNKEEVVYLAKEICVKNYVSAMTKCNVSFAVNAFTSVVVAVAVGIAATPIAGGGTGVALLSANGYAYYSCSVNAADAYKFCQSQP